MVENFTTVLSYDQIKNNNYSFSAGQYFDVKIEYEDITQEQFSSKIDDYNKNLKSLFSESKHFELEILKQLGKLKI